MLKKRMNKITHLFLQVTNKLKVKDLKSRLKSKFVILIHHNLFVKIYLLLKHNSIMLKLQVVKHYAIQQFPRESIEMTKQLFLSKFERRQEVINEKLLKYKDKFKEEERKQSYNQMNQKFKQKFKKQYLNQIFTQSILSSNTEQDKQKKEVIFQYQKSELQIQLEKTEQKEKIKQAKQFLSQKHLTKSGSQISNDEIAQHVDYITGIETMKKNFSDFILECVKREVDSNFILTFKQVDSINNHRKSEILNKQRSTSVMSYSQRLSIAEQGNSPVKKRGSIFSNLSQAQKSSRQSLSLSQNKQIQDEETNGSGKRRSTLMKVLEDQKRKSSILNQSLLNQQSKSDSQIRKNLIIEKSKELYGSNQLEESNAEGKEDNSNDDLKTESESESSQNSMTHLSNNCIQANQQQKQDINYQAKQRASLFKNKKPLDFNNIQPLPYLNPFSDRLNAQRQNNSANSSPKALKLSDKPQMFQNSPKMKLLASPQAAAYYEKSLLLEDTWDMGFGNEKQLEIDLKQQLKIRGLLKVESQKTEIKQLFPALSKYQRGKIEQKIQKIKQQSERINNHAAANMQVSAIQDNSNQVTNRSFLVNDKLNQENTNDKSLQPMDILDYQKQSPYFQVDQNDEKVINKQVSLPAIPIKNNTVHNRENPPLNLPQISQTPNSRNNKTKLDSLPIKDLSSQRDSLSLKENLSFRSPLQQRPPFEQITPKVKSSNVQNFQNLASISPKANFVKNINLASLNNQSLNRIQSSSIGGIVQEEILKGYKCGSPLQLKLHSFNTPRSQLFKLGQVAQGQNSSSSYRVKSVSSPKQVQMKDATIQTPKQTYSDFHAQDYLLSSQKKKEPEITRQRNISEQGQNMLQRINYQRPTIFHNVLNREKKQFNQNIN